MEKVDTRLHSTVVKKYPSTRDSFVNGSWRWIEGKRVDDGAEGLWRVHDKLYDLTSFVAKHPGGQFWLEVTKSTDVTEAFESHHITPVAGETLKNYYVRDAVFPRNYTFTYDQNGFYQTLKKRVAEKLKTIDTSVTSKSKLIHDFNLLMLCFAAAMMHRSDDLYRFIFWNFITSQCLAWSQNFSHNFIHQADNWRMYTSNVSLINWRDFRIYHILSHHMYPNSYADFEVSCYEPYFKWLPSHTKSIYYKIVAILVAPLIYFLHFHNMWRYRLQGGIWAKEKVVFWDEFVGFLIPTVLITFGREPVTWGYLLVIYFRWSSISLVGEFLYGMFHFNRGHHGTEQVHQSDEITSYDFGEYQLSTTVDRVEANYNLFTTLAYSGEQVLHHLFPTLDAAVLPQLKDTFLKTCKEFKIRPQPDITILKATIGQFKQLYRSNSKLVTSCYSSNSSAYALLGTVSLLFYYYW